MSDERKRLDELLKLMIQERLDNMLFLTEDDDEPKGAPQLSWLSGQGAQEIEDQRAGSYQDDDLGKPWDDRLEELSVLLNGIAFDVIDYYKSKEKPSFTKEAAKKEILETVGVPLGVFFGDVPEFGDLYSLDSILEEEFEDMNENYAELGNPGVSSVDIYDDSNKAGMGEISENISTNRDDGEEEYESNTAAEAIAALEKIHQNLEGIIAKLKEAPNAPLGTDIAMAYSSLDEALTHLQRRK